jgi:hypothetical protein
MELPQQVGRYHYYNGIWIYSFQVAGPLFGSNFATLDVFCANVTKSQSQKEYKSNTFLDSDKSDTRLSLRKNSVLVLSCTIQYRFSLVYLYIKT